MSPQHSLANASRWVFSNPDPRPEGPAERFARAALERHKREGMELAFRARIATLAVFAVMLPFIAPFGELIYFEALLLLLAIIGWLQRRVAQTGRSGLEVLLILADIVILTAAIAAPNPLHSINWPPPMELRSEAFKYFFVFLAFGTLAYSWRTVRAIGNVTALVWTAAIALIWLTTTPDAKLGAAAEAAFGHSKSLLDHLDPNSLLAWIRIQEVIIFVVVAWVLSTTVRRFSRLLLTQAELERERANLARYFSPNVVAELSHNDEPLKRIRTQEVAVMFVDIVGFTRFAAERTAETVIETLRAFHARMETEVFRHSGTLDKYLGDGLMATFGTPVAGERDARNAFACAEAMLDVMTAWNAQRAAAGEPPIQANIGIHYGPAVLGDVGANRLEFAVIGDTVNVASRVESLTRSLEVRIAVTEAAVAQARSESPDDADPAAAFSPLGAHPIRGLERAVEIWGRR